MKVLSLVGARPQFIKEAMLNEAFLRNGINEVLVNSGQHYDVNMSEVFFKVLTISKPAYNLEVGSGSHAEMTGRIMVSFEKVAIKESPDIIVVYGDTNTTIAGALVGAKLKIPIAHVEAGIRMLPRDMPEEINRVLTDRISSLLFCPTEQGIANLKSEGISKGVYFTGDIMYDLYLKMENRINLEFYREITDEKTPYILFTLHRDYNVDNKEKLKRIMEEITKLSKMYTIIFPAHPRTLKKIKEFGISLSVKSLILTEPLDYLSLISLVKKSILVITDSGGLQKESYFAGKRAIVLMPDTGWKELIDNGWNTLTDEIDLCNKVDSLVPVQYYPNLYGIGDTSDKIIDIIKKY